MNNNKIYFLEKLNFTLKKVKNLYLFFLLLFVLIITNQSCINPFAPGLVENYLENNILSDQKSIDGLFQNFRYAYMFKDTLVYGELLNDDFRFIFRDFDKGIDESWGREEEMRTTYRLFQATQNIDLYWNDVVNSIGDSVLQDISRGFNLTIIFSATDIISIYGRVNLRISRPNSEAKWKISQWRDESNF